MVFELLNTLCSSVKTTVRGHLTVRTTYLAFDYQGASLNDDNAMIVIYKGIQTMMEIGQISPPMKRMGHPPLDYDG